MRGMEIGGDRGLRRKSRVDRMIETLASGLGSSVGWLAEHGILFGIFAVAWIALAAGLIWSRGTIDQAWTSIHALPLVAQAVVWLLFLPVMVGLWIWETTWPVIVRVVLVVSIAGWNLLVFLPKAAQAPRL